jgi:predicted outer membrane protein
VALCAQDGRMDGATRAGAWARRVAALTLVAASAVSWPAVAYAQDPRANAATGLVARIDPLVPGPNGELPDGWVDTQWGALGPVDVSLVEGVRRADLWEGEAGQLAVAKGASARVREIGAIISNQHLKELDPLTLKVGEQLGVALPNEPSEEQESWLVQMRQNSGEAFDDIFVTRLRAAHAKVFSLIATVRANTRNSLMRSFAQTANRYVDGHISMLDSTNLVEFNALPTPNVPAGRPLGSPVAAGLSPMVIWAILFAAVVAGVAVSVRIVRPR